MSLCDKVNGKLILPPQTHTSVCSEFSLVTLLFSIYRGIPLSDQSTSFIKTKITKLFYFLQKLYIVWLHLAGPVNLVELFIFLLQLHNMVRHSCSVCRRCVSSVQTNHPSSPLLKTSLSSTYVLLGLQWPSQSGALQRRAVRLRQSSVPGCCQYLEQSTYW